MSGYDAGDLVRLTGSFYNELDALKDPTDVVLKVFDPEGNVTEFALGDLTHPGTGIFYYDYELDSDAVGGWWTYRYEGTGAVTEAGNKKFWVRSIPN